MPSRMYLMRDQINFHKQKNRTENTIQCDFLLIRLNMPIFSFCEALVNQCAYSQKLRSL